MKRACRRHGLALRRVVTAAWCAAALVGGLAWEAASEPARAAELWIGAATADITPDRPVPLTGGTSVRIGREVLNRCTANVLALESRDDVRRRIHERHGQHVCVLGFCAPAGDQTPRPQVHKRSEQRMLELRGLDYRQEIGRRVANALDDVAGVIAKDIRTDVPFVHRVEQIELPARNVTDAEYAVAKQVCETIDAKKTLSKSDYWTRGLYAFIAERYLAQQEGEWKTFPVELHALRLGDVAIATNPFELFLDYGLQIQGRSPAVQTFLIQLATSPREHGYYVPTPRAMAGGALDDKPFTNYSATVMSNTVGPEGGQVLVDRTLEAIEELWEEK